MCTQLDAILKQSWFCLISFFCCFVLGFVCGHSLIWTQGLQNQSPTIWTRFTVTFLTGAAKCGMKEGEVWEMVEGKIYYGPFDIMFKGFVNVDTDCYLSSMSVH